MTEEERLRAEAAKRMARRRRKLENAEERLAKITGQPVGSIVTSGDCFSSPVSSLPSSPDEGMRDPFSMLTEGTLTTTPPSPGSAPDPPLENLVRSLTGGDGSSIGGSSSSAATVAAPVSNLVWVGLAFFTFLILQFGHGDYIMNSLAVPFVLLLLSLWMLGRLPLTNSAVGSIVSAVLVLCGLKPGIVQFFINSAQVGFTVARLFSLYLTSFILLHALYHNVLLPANS